MLPLLINLSLFLLLLLLLLLLLQVCVSAAAKLCHPSDEAALTAFKTSFSNPNPFPGWDPTIFDDCCDWNGVACNQTTGRVIDLNIGPYTTLTGTIPSSLSDLNHLINLRLHKIPNLVGPIPPSLAKLSTLRYLIISWTNISGPVPHFLSHLHNLEYLDLSFNNLSGSIPPSLPSLPFLFALDLSRNRLTGPIPETFGHFQVQQTAANAMTIVLSHNSLSGTLPSSLSNANLSSVDISRNNLWGDASVLFGKGKGTSSIDISRNGFEFDLSKVRFMESLDTLDISHNGIYGRIPEQITEAVLLQFLNVSYNRLCGEIPAGWRWRLRLRYRKESWDNSSFLHNRCLCGPPLDPC